ncbi:MAG: transcriptional repressor [Sulfitobacter sp.]|uniref:Fur family transcriptional regulator n=1 Tax=Sulfitobacter TaxID=60136 RepID=UPI000066B177|nr:MULTISPECIES: Fur family transcriptional regulator [unclassified Sulfitobacter]AXI50755.1 transcriptional repressor [Sulfitobacter sp. SK025]EAP80364.1 probable ferric uptake regulation protein [Sulfitobacter sp. NAS-14.1]MCP3878668.1 transcriptional repressor [Sulfitobacter sp.]
MTHSADYKQLLREAGLRVTPQRTTIVSLLSETDDHPNVEDLYEKARRLDDTVSVATVYRTMSVLENAGLVRKLVLDDAPARYEMMPHTDHDHLVDVDSGDLVEIPGIEIATLLDRVAAEMGYELVSHHTVIRARKL